MKPLLSRGFGMKVMTSLALSVCMGSGAAWAADATGDANSAEASDQNHVAPHVGTTIHSPRQGPAAAPGINVDISSFPQSEQQEINQGHALAVAGDCAACHSLPHSSDDQMFAGGYAISSPLGTIFSSNITPSKQHGIGNYTEEEFSRAVRDGVRRDGANLYPAMPYTSYAGITDEDMHHLYVYFMRGVKPVEKPSPETQLPFPFSIRASMKAWNMLYLDQKPFENDPDQSEEWNRGAYLVGPLEHCSACHTPRNVMMAEKVGDHYLAGGSVGSWYAPNITSDEVSGIGSWSNDQIVQYLKTGHVPGKAQAGGGMAEAVEHSLQYLPDSDLQAIAVYLKSTHPIRTSDEEKARFDYERSQTEGLEDELRGKHPQNSNHTMDSGAALYSGYCASCHQPDGSGSKNQAYPSLFNNSVTGADNANNLVSVILEGVDRNADGHHVLMPAFGQNSYVDELNDTQIASITNYVTKTFGNPDVQVTPEQVAQLRAGGPKPLMAQMQPYMLPLMIIGAIVVVLLIVLVVVKVKRRKKRA